MKRALAIAAVLELVVVAVLLHSAIKNFLWSHPWWHSFLVAIPGLVLAFFDWQHSGEANRLRSELDTQRNRHLGQIARNTEKPITQAERNAEVLRKHLRAKVAVTEGDGSWAGAPEIVDISDSNIATLFVPRSYSSPSAWCVEVKCEDLEITPIPQGNCPLRIRVLKRHGPHHIDLGEITKWEDRFQPAASPIFAKGGTAYYATYSKTGSTERRSLYIYASADGANSFLLEASTGEKRTADNKEISKQFMILQIDYQAVGFARSNSGRGGSTYPLFVC